MGFPKWFYEAMGTSVFVITSSMAYTSGSGDVERGFYFAAAFALCHFSFNSHSEAFFNPLLSMGKFMISSGSDWADLFCTIMGQIFGAWFGIQMGSALFSDFAIPAQGALSGHFATDFSKEMMCAALFCILFFSSERGSAKHGMSSAIWMMAVFYMMASMVTVIPNVGSHIGNMFSGGFAAPGEGDMVRVVGGVMGTMVGALFFNWFGE